MLTYNLDIEQGSLWLRTTPTEFALNQPFYCTEAGIFYAGRQFNTVRDYKDSYLLFYTIEGSGIIEQNGAVTKLLPGQALLINCRQPQSYYTDPNAGTWVHYWVHFDGAGVKAMEPVLIPERRSRPVVMQETAAVRHFDELLRNLENTSSDIILSESLMIHQLLNDLRVQSGIAPSRNRTLIMKTVGYINDHCTERIDLQTLLGIAGMSKAYYMRLFRQYVGTTPYNHILSLRITRAKELLEVTDLTVHEIALQTGFSDDASFSTRFSSVVGLSPLKYRQSAITRRQAVTSARQ